MNTVTTTKLITCIVPRGMGTELVDALHEDKGMVTTNVAHGRGVSKRAGYFSEEVDVLSVVVDQTQADDVFVYLYEVIEVDQTKGRFMYQQALALTNAFKMPENVEEEEQ